MWSCNGWQSTCTNTNGALSRNYIVLICFILRPQLNTGVFFLILKINCYYEQNSVY